MISDRDLVPTKVVDGMEVKSRREVVGEEEIDAEGILAGGELYGVLCVLLDGALEDERVFKCLTIREGLLIKGLPSL